MDIKEFEMMEAFEMMSDGDLLVLLSEDTEEITDIKQIVRTFTLSYLEANRLDKRQEEVRLIKAVLRGRVEEMRENLTIVNPDNNEMQQEYASDIREEEIGYILEIENILTA